MSEYLRSKAIAYALKEAAEENLGIYPQAVRGGDHAYEKRTDWMEGWNAAVMAFHEHEGKFSEWLQSIPAQSKILVEDLLLEGKLNISERDEGVAMWVTCSDTFFWGCADGEDMSMEELPALAACYALSPKYGGELWVARKRGMRPQTASYVECYPESEWHLFDAAGPERSDPDGRGRAKLASDKISPDAAAVPDSVETPSQQD